MRNDQAAAICDLPDRFARSGGDGFTIKRKGNAI
jgi:hypothetical protein